MESIPATARFRFRSLLAKLDSQSKVFIFILVVMVQVLAALTVDLFGNFLNFLISCSPSKVNMTSDSALFRLSSCSCETRCKIEVVKQTFLFKLARIRKRTWNEDLDPNLIRVCSGFLVIVIRKKTFYIIYLRITGLCWRNILPGDQTKYFWLTVPLSPVTYLFFHHLTIFCLLCY